MGAAYALWGLDGRAPLLVGTMPALSTARGCWGALRRAVIVSDGRVVDEKGPVRREQLDAVLRASAPPVPADVEGGGSPMTPDPIEPEALAPVEVLAPVAVAPEAPAPPARVAPVAPETSAVVPPSSAPAPARTARRRRRAARRAPVPARPQDPLTLELAGFAAWCAQLARAFGGPR